jgi:hypothetical protein
MDMARTKNTMTTRLLISAAIVEVATGLGLLLMPSVVSQLLLGGPLTGLAIPLAGVAGIALISLGLACWPGPARVGMVTYGAGVAAYLAYIGLSDGTSGVLLWPAVALHVVLTTVLMRPVARDAPASSDS